LTGSDRLRILLFKRFKVKRKRGWRDQGVLPRSTSVSFEVTFANCSALSAVSVVHGTKGATKSLPSKEIALTIDKVDCLKGEHREKEYHISLFSLTKCIPRITRCPRGVVRQSWNKRCFLCNLVVCVLHFNRRHLLGTC
jgi:hypothetical protein